MNTAILWPLFYLGLAAHVLMQAGASVKSDSNGVTNLVQWLRLNWHVIVARTIVSSLLLLLWMEYPGAIRYVATEIPMVPITPATVGLGGFFVDSFLNPALFIVGQRFGLKVEMPQVVPPPGGK